MQYEFELNNTLSNQTFSTTLNNVDMEITIRTGGSNDNPITFFNLLIDDEYLCTDVPCFANQGILPYDYMVKQIGGQFFFDTEEDEYPYFENFNNSCKLYFVTTDELNG